MQLRAPAPPHPGGGGARPVRDHPPLRNGRTGRALIHIILRRRKLAPAYVPPVSVVLAADKGSYIAGLTEFRDGDLGGWVERFATATARAALLAEGYLGRVTELQDRWRHQVREHLSLRSAAAAWAVIDVLPAHPVITVPVAVTATGRSKSSTTVAVDHLVDAAVLRPLSESKRNRAWEATGLLPARAERGRIRSSLLEAAHPH